MAENEEKKGEQPSADGSEKTEGKKSKKKLFIILGILLLVAGGGGGGAFFFLKGKKPADPAAEVKDGHAAADPEAPAGHEAAADGHAAADAKGDGHEGKDAAHQAAGAEAGKDAKAGDKPADAKGDGHGGKDAAADKGAAKEAGGAPGFGETYAFKPFHLNLGNPLENRYVRIEISAEYKGGEDQKKEMEARLPQLRDAIISVVQSKTREFILSPTGKDRLRYEVTTQLNQLMTKKVENVYITDLIIE